MFRNRFVSLVLVGLFVWMTGCSSHTQIELGEVADHGKVRVTTTDGDKETIHDPRVEADTIVGKNATAIPLDRVAELEAVGTDEVGTVFTVLGLLVFVGVVACAAACDFEIWN